MARSSILSDELLRQLVAVGQVDILVGVPTFNNAATIQSVVTTLHVGLAKHFPRERTVIVSPDGGSDDGTRDLVRGAPMAAEELAGSSTLRTTHRVSVTYPGLPGRSGGVRTVFAAADLLQARVVVIFDPTVSGMTPDWVEALARPVWKGESDLVLPIHPRHRLDAPLMSQLVRPLLGAAYGRRLRSNLAGDFACTGKFAARQVGRSIWEQDLILPALDVWLVATAMGEDLRLSQAHLGPAHFAPRAARAGLPELFAQVVGTAFRCLDENAAAWLERLDPADLPTHGQPGAPVGAEPSVDLGPMAERFRSGIRDLAPLLREILAAETIGRLQAAAQGADMPRIADALWVETVYEFAASAHRGVMSREHLAQAMVPLYLGRVASFFSEIAALSEEAYATRLAALEGEFESLRPSLVESWKSEGGR
ncbi:MAG: hypothetical protein ABI960_01240 [Candidatus Eisenbacteria bacterium]